MAGLSTLVFCEELITFPEAMTSRERAASRLEVTLADPVTEELRVTPWSDAVMAVEVEDFE